MPHFNRQVFYQILFVRKFPLVHTWAPAGAWINTHSVPPPLPPLLLARPCQSQQCAYSFHTLTCLITCFCQKGTYHRRPKSFSHCTSLRQPAKM